MEINVKTFLQFSRYFVPYYLRQIIKDDSDIVNSTLSALRKELSEAFPDESDMLTQPYLSFLQPFLDELGIEILFDKANSVRTDRIAFTKSMYLIREERRIKFHHYLFPGDIFIPTVHCVDCVGYISSTTVCAKTPLMKPAFCCEVFEERKTKDGIRYSLKLSPKACFQNAFGWGLFD